jgi:hypothetical protein
MRRLWKDEKKENNDGEAKRKENNNKEIKRKK